MLTFLIFLPLVGVVLLYLFPAPQAWRPIAVGTSGVVLVMGMVLAALFNWQRGTMQFEEHVPWIPALGASYHLAIDGLSLPLMLLTALLTIIAAHPFVGTGMTATLILFGFLIGFGIKLPVIPFHSWLPDAHTEAPTEGSVILAGLLLKLGGYGLLRLALPTVPDALSAWAIPLAAIAVVSAIYGAAVAMAQS